MKKGIAGLLLFTVICLGACHKTIIRPTVSQQFSADSTLIVNYLADNHINATLHDSIWYVLNEIGTGLTPTRFNCVLIKYSGYELDALLPGGTGIPFQQNVNPDGLKGPLKHLGESTTGVYISVSGLQVALKKFPMGSKGRVFIPSYMGYGATGQTNFNGTYVVQPNKCVVFDVELVALSDYNVDGNYCYE